MFLLLAPGVSRQGSAPHACQRRSLRLTLSSTPEHSYRDGQDDYLDHRHDDGQADQSRCVVENLTDASSLRAFSGRSTRKTPSNLSTTIETNPVTSSCHLIMTTLTTMMMTMTTLTTMTITITITMTMTMTLPPVHLWVELTQSRPPPGSEQTPTSLWPLANTLHPVSPPSPIKIQKI